MSKTTDQYPANSSRRKFLKQSSLALAGVAVAGAPFVHTARAAAVAEIKIGLIGCGGRGTGAVLDALGAATKIIYPSAGYHTEDGKAIEWDVAMRSTRRLGPEKYEFGHYPTPDVAMPGTYRFL